MAIETRKIIPDLANGSALTGTELVPVYQGRTVKIALNALATFLVPLVAAVSPWTDVASAATTDLSGGPINARITGTANIASFGAITSGSRRYVRAAGAFTLVHGANLDCPGSTSIVAAAGDRFTVVGLGGGAVLIEDYQRQNGTPLVGAGVTSVSVGNGMSGGGTGAVAVALTNPITLTAAQASTSGTAVDFGSIPAGVKRISINLANVSTNGAGSSPLQVQIGTSGGLQNTGYSSGSALISGSNSTGLSGNTTTGFILSTGLSAAANPSGIVTLDLVDAATGTWVMTSIVHYSGFVYMAAGVKTLSGVLDRLRLTTINGTDAFDAGSVSVTYE